MQKHKILISSIVVILFFILLFFIPQKRTSSVIKSVSLAGQTINVQVASTSLQQEQGLSGRTGLKENEGLLFVFSKPDTYRFWMKDMLFPIDIIWLDPYDGINFGARVVYIKKDARPELFPETYGPKDSAQYVLEVVSGFSDKNNLKVGDKVEFNY